MTDKEKREFKDGVISIFKRFNILDNTATIGGLRDDILRYIDSMQEEPVKDRFAFKAIPRLLEMIEPSERAKSYVTKLADAFDSEGYYTDAKIVRESLKIMNGENVAMATMDEEPVSKDLEEELPKVWDRETLNEYAYQVAYDLSNDWLKETAAWDDVETAVKLGAKWQLNKIRRENEKNRG